MESSSDLESEENVVRANKTTNSKRKHITQEDQF